MILKKSIGAKVSEETFSKFNKCRAKLAKKYGIKPTKAFLIREAVNILFKEWNVLELRND